MAVSSSIGSNLFDVTVGLPLPWLLYTIIFGRDMEVFGVNITNNVQVLIFLASRRSLAILAKTNTIVQLLFPANPIKRPPIVHLVLGKCYLFEGTSTYLLLKVYSVGIGCSIGMLFVMLLLVFISIIAFKWEMTKPMGGIMMVLYLVFVIVSLGLSECWIICPF